MNRMGLEFRLQPVGRRSAGERGISPTPGFHLQGPQRSTVSRLKPELQTGPRSGGGVQGTALVHGEPQEEGIRIEGRGRQSTGPASPLNELKRSDIVTSKRGKAGGYVLARHPAKVSLREVVQAVEPALLATPAASSGSSGPAVTNVWQGLSIVIVERLDSINLETMASEAGAPMYFI
jgi:hypothetical protein